MSTEVLNAIALEGDAAIVTIRWSINRNDEPSMGGVSSQLWRVCEGPFRIVFEHAS